MNQKVLSSNKMRRISPRTLDKCSSERAVKAKQISKALFGASNKTELKKQLKSTTNENQARAADYYDFDFEKGEPTKISKKNNYLWDCAPSKDVPKVYRVCSVKRNTKAPQNCFEGQLPKLRYYHPSSFEKMQQDNNNNSCSGVSKLISVGNSTIIHRTRSGGACQTKITDFLKEKKRLSPSATYKPRKRAGPSAS